MAQRAKSSDEARPERVPARGAGRAAPRAAGRCSASAPAPLPDREFDDLAPRDVAALRKRLVRPLSAWFRRSARPFPWRPYADGYHALVAETMLQQTQTARVVERFPAFIRLFPDVRALAAADEQAVLAAWRGMGYYRRARNLHAAAKRVVADHGGEVPAEASRLRELPGVGRYTAGAIASIRFGRSEAIVDGNVRRVLARWFLDGARPECREAERRSWRRATMLVRIADDPASFNEGMMELGATLCSPRSPRCADCPVAGACPARAAGRQEEIPTPKAAPRVVDAWHHVVILRRGARTLLERRGDGGLWAGLWQPLSIESGEALEPTEVVARLSVAVRDLRERGRFVHRTTHRRIEFVVHEARTTGRVVADASRRGTGARWFAAAEAEELPMSVAHRRALGLGVEVDSG